MLAATAFATRADDRSNYNARAAADLVALFGTLDRNADHRLTREEATGDLNMEPRFNELDGNRDGVITRQELNDYIELRYAVARPA
jgi:hypothetical protein